MDIPREENMSQAKPRITMVSLKEPCSACLIIDGLLRETLDKLGRETDIDVEFIVLENLKDVSKVEGLEVEKFPALLINGEQVTAGGLVTERQLRSLISQ